MAGPTTSGPTAPAPAARVLVVGVVEDEVRAHQAARAFDVWRRANRRLGIGPVAIVAHRASGATSHRTFGVLRPARGALTAMLAGLLLAGLPAAGAAAVVGWAVSSVVLGLAGLVGALPDAQVGPMVVLVTMVFAAIGFALGGLVGALIGCLVGLTLGAVDRSARGLSRPEVTRTVAGLSPGAWATVVRTRMPAAPLVCEELERLGAAAVVWPAGPAVAAPTPPARGSESAPER